jgi:Glycosyl transferase family 2
LSNLSGVAKTVAHNGIAQTERQSGSFFQQFLGRWLNGALAREISCFSAYFDQIVQFCPMAHDDQGLLASCVASKRSVATKQENIAEIMAADQSSRNLILINGNLNYSLDCQSILESIRKSANRHSRVVVVSYNSYLRFAFIIANWLKLRRGPQANTFLTRRDLDNLAKISGFEVLSHRPVAYSPFSFFGVGTFLNRIFTVIPIFRWLGLASISILRPIGFPVTQPPLTILIPARNERGNIEPAVIRTLQTGLPVKEIIFVEGHSQDGTWEEIKRVQAAYGKRIEIASYQQAGKGKADAVRLGISKSTGEVLTILDADLTMPPEDLSKFYNVYAHGLADFVNGSRLVYPMEGEAMRFLNRLGNLFFAGLLSMILRIHVNDTLCGTKLFAKIDYDRFVKWRADFGDFDPFGDFELLFPAAILGLGVAEVPIHYRARVYGSTQISRFYHGFMLLRMCAIGFYKVALGK